MRRGVKKGLVITGIVFGVIVCFVLAVGITSRVGNEANMKYAAELEKVVVEDPLPAPLRTGISKCFSLPTYISAGELSP